MRLVAALALVILLPASLAAEPADSIHSFTLDRIDGTSESLAVYEGRVLLVVNVASKCGFTPQYAGLEALHEKYAARGFAVLGFPANDFRGQEPGSNAEIAEFCRATYDIRFPMFSKIHVKGEQIHPLYAWITRRPPPVGGAVAWNFQKYLVDRQGRVVARFEPRTVPDDPALVNRLEELLAAPPPER